MLTCGVLVAASGFPTAGCDWLATEWTRKNGSPGRTAIRALAETAVRYQSDELLGLAVGVSLGVDLGVAQIGRRAR